MKKTHPRLGLLEVIDESPLFLRVINNDPKFDYEFWIPRADFAEVEREPAEKKERGRKKKS
jgi:hypothetical protein